ncbi:MAG: SCO family protein [Phycisphaerales bacterium]|nr:SCO family protein [Phycisphaerales bacterium]
MSTRTTSFRPRSLAVTCCALLTASTAAIAQFADQVPPQHRGVGISQKLDNQLPLDAYFSNEKGQVVHLGDYFKPGKPIILTLNYYNCPGLCTYQLNGLVDALRELKWTPGNEFDIITVSFDPMENSKLAVLKKESYLAAYGKPEAAAGWHFLCGDKDSIARLVEAAGFAYRWNPDTQQWVHDAALIIVKPDGKISRYIGSIKYEPETVRLSLVEASKGKVGSIWDQIFLLCAHYDSQRGVYTAQAMAAMRLAGFATLTTLGITLGAFWAWERRKKSSTLTGLAT